MKRIIISVEGQSEQEFVKTILAPYLNNKGIFDIRAIPIKKTNGGLVRYSHLKRDVMAYVNENNVLVTSFIDYFRIPPCFPGYVAAQHYKTADEKIACMEEAFAEDIGFYNFIPYIQKYEFESLLFSSDGGFKKHCEVDQWAKTKKIIDAYENPENINNSPETSPSNRLKAIIPGYNKILLGTLIGMEIGINSMLEKCPRFRRWVNGLIQQGQQ